MRKFFGTTVMSEKILKIVREFNVHDDVHVAWLKKMTFTSPENYVQVLKENPMKQDVDSKDVMYWAQLHMCLCAKYVQYIFTR